MTARARRHFKPPLMNPNGRLRRIVAAGSVEAAGTLPASDRNCAGGCCLSACAACCAAGLPSPVAFVPVFRSMTRVAFAPSQMWPDREPESLRRPPDPSSESNRISEFARHARAARNRRQFRLKDDHMLSHFGRALRALAVTAALFAAIAPASAHEGHDHEEQPPVSAGALPRGETDSERVRDRGDRPRRKPRDLSRPVRHERAGRPVQRRGRSPDGPVKGCGRRRRHLPRGSAVARQERTHGPDFHGHGRRCHRHPAADDSDCASRRARRCATRCGA